jgi:hypothetical protein
VVEALRALATDPDEASPVLELTPGQRGEIDVNTRLQSSPTLPAIDHYTGAAWLLRWSDSVGISLSGAYDGEVLLRA